LPFGGGLLLDLCYLTIAPALLFKMRFFFTENEFGTPQRHDG
jgi:hypothetical protein